MSGGKKLPKVAAIVALPSHLFKNSAEGQQPCSRERRRDTATMAAATTRGFSRPSFPGGKFSERIAPSVNAAGAALETS